MLREIIIIDPNNPDKPVRLLTSIPDVAANVVGELYRWRWKIEMYLPYCLHCQNFYQVATRGLGVLNSAA